MPLEFVARAIVLDENQKILLVKTYPGDRPWTLPGGHVEQDETFQGACIRELQEELSMTIELLPTPQESDRPNITSLTPPVAMFLGEYTRDGKTRRAYEAIFLARKIDGNDTLQVEEIAEIRWFTKSEIVAMTDQEIYSQLRDIIVQFA